MAAGALGDITGEGWSFYNAGDAPEGAWNYYGNAAITATIALPISLIAGNWYIFLKFHDYDVHRNVYYTVGSDTSDTIATDDRNFNGEWSSHATLNVVTPGATLVVHFSTGTGSSSHMFRGLFLTRDANVTVLATDTVVNLNYPSVMDTSTAVKGNLIPNGGFETGVGNEWGFAAQGSGRTVPASIMWDSTQGWEGACCFKLLGESATRLNPSNTSEAIYSRVYHLKANKQYSISCYVKTSTGLSTTASISAYNTFIPPAGYTGQHSITSGAVAVSSAGWTRISVTDYLLAYPTCDYNLMISIASVPDGAYALIDGVQLEEGTLSAFAPAATMEAAILIDQSAKPGHIYYDTDTLTATLRVRNHSAGSLTKDFKYEVYDYMNRVVLSGTVPLTIAATTTYTDTAFSIATAKLGVFRLVSWINGMDRTEREIVYSIIPAVPTGADADSYLGTHPNFWETELAAIQRLGIKWARDLSPEALVRWIYTEPTDDSFVYHDTRLAALVARDIKPMLVLGYQWPAFADSSGLPNLTEFNEYVTNVVNHYKTLGCDCWEVWNEPPTSAAGSLTASFYAQLLHGATDAILTAQPTAKVIAIGGVGPSFITSVITELGSQFPGWDWQTKFYAMSTHNYIGGVNPEDLTTIINTYTPQVWNTESGVWDWGFYSGPSCNFVSWGKDIWPHTSAARFNKAAIWSNGELIKNFVRTIGSGQTKYFQYDSRYYADPTFFNSHTSMWELDGSIRSKGIAFGIAGRLIDKSTTLGNVSPDSNSHMYLFDTGANPIACLYSTDFAPRQITIGLSGGQFEVLDMMGNVISSTATIKYGRIPIWVRGLGISAATLSSSLSGGTVATRSDLDAPTITIQDGPRGPMPASSIVRMRWIGVDDTSYPNLGEINIETQVPVDIPNPEAILYQYRLTPYSSWSTPTARNYVDYVGLPNGTYTFEVKATDTAANTSSTVSRSVQIGSARWLCAR